MEIVVTGRHCEVPERFRRHLEDKLAKVAQLAPRVQALHVELSHEPARRQSATCDRVEITVRQRGPVIRAEASADEPYAALDLATAKLLERLRRVRDRRKVHHGRHTPTSLREATSVPPGAVEAVVAGAPADEVPEEALHGDALAAVAADGDCPVVIREKAHPARPMSIDQALEAMELVGHDFYLYVDAASGRPSVVYRRKGWSYGVIRLEHEEAHGSDEDHAPTAAAAAAAASQNGHGPVAAEVLRR